MKKYVHYHTLNENKEAVLSKKKTNFLENSPIELHNLLKKVLKINKKYWISQENSGDGVCIRTKKGRGPFDELRVFSPEIAKSQLISAYKAIQHNGSGGVIEMFLIDSYGGRDWSGEYIGMIELF